ncbi:MULTISPECIES: carboxylesterase family protein [Virgibacillus]|nr:MULTISPECIES: carboxylesterase family protein [Virgibacillus]
MIIGTNHDEGAFFFTPESPIASEEAMTAMIEKVIGKPAAKQVSGLYSPSLEGQSQLMTDFVFWKPSIELAEAQADHASVWMYRFDWHIPSHPQLNKAAHALEIPFVFQNLFYFTPFEVQIDPSMLALSQQAWVSFAKTGNPNNTEKLAWPTYHLNDRQTLIFDNPMKVVEDPYREKRKIFTIH